MTIINSRSLTLKYDTNLGSCVMNGQVVTLGGRINSPWSSPIACKPWLKYHLTISPDHEKLTPILYFSHYGQQCEET